MSGSTPNHQSLDHLFRTERPKVLATLIRLLGDFDLAEDAMQAAFLVAAETWNEPPKNPTAWLISTARFKAVDSLRRKTKLHSALQEYANRLADHIETEIPDENQIEDDRLRLIYICCHPALTQDAQIALTLREVCGLTTEEIAAAFLTKTPTIAQRIVRAKAKIRDEKIPFELPEPAERAERTQSVLFVTYLLFNEGYYTSRGESPTRQTLSEEAIRLARLLAELSPSSEAEGLLGLMLLHESRREARFSEEGEMILFDDQDPKSWNQALIQEGLVHAHAAMATPDPGPYALQSAIAAQHMQGAHRNWQEITSLYDRLLAKTPSPIVELNRAVAVSMADSEQAALQIVDHLIATSLSHYAYAHSTRADLCRRLGLKSEAAKAYRQALELSSQSVQRRFLQKRLEELAETG
jgi:RNA polymerase sigma-70 factor (ECF subfamily)